MGKIIPELNEKFTSMAFCVPTENLLVMDRTYCLEKLQRMRSSKKKKKKGESGIRGPLKNQDVSCHFNNDTYSFTFDAGTGTSLMITFSNSFPDIIMNLATETRWYTL